MDQLGRLVLHAVGQLVQLLGVVAVVLHHIGQQRQRLLRRVLRVSMLMTMVMVMGVLVAMVVGMGVGMGHAVGVGVFMVYPLLWMVGSTFKTNAEIFTSLSPFTAHPTLDGYYNAVTKTYGGDITIWRAFLNTYSYVIPKVVFTVISSVIAAYGFSRFKFKGRDFLFGVMIMTLFLPQVVLNIPQFLMYRQFGWVDSPYYLALIMPTLFAQETYFVYMLIQFMRNIPRELDEAAKIDGCNIMQTLVLVLVPMLWPAMVSAGLFQFMWSSNDFMGPLLYVNSPARYPATLFVRMSMDADTGFAWNRVMAVSLISIIPSLVVFFLAQRQFMDGVTAGAVKG